MNWNPDPIIFEIGQIEFSWYGFLFTIGLLCAYLMMLVVFLKEGKKDKHAFIVFICAYLGAIVGARLGHCFFYNPDYYLEHPFMILQFWKGGLASHGAVIGIALALWICAKFILKISFLGLGDKVIAGICLVAAFVRIGNLMNSEILGKVTNLPWGFTFTHVDNLNRHPTQIYEAIFYLGTAIFLWFYYNKNRRVGATSGYFFILMFSARFCIEFFKESHSVFEHDLVLNMGQLLSLPLIVFGIYLVSNKSKSQSDILSQQKAR